LVLKAGVWYVVARTDGQLRTYRVSRVLDARPTDDRYERPAGFDLAAFWIASSAAYERDTPRVEVTLRIRPEAVGHLADMAGTLAWSAREALDASDPDGWRHLRIRLDWPQEVPGRLLGLGANAEILGPPDVRERVAR